MLTLPPGVGLFVATQPVDGRKGADSLMVLVRDVMLCDPLSGHLFVFFSRRHDRVRILYWDRNGFAMWSKRLERGRFHWTMTLDGRLQASPIEAGQLALIPLLDEDAPGGIRTGTIWCWVGDSRWVTYVYAPLSGSDGVRDFLGDDLQRTVQCDGTRSPPSSSALAASDRDAGAMRDASSLRPLAVVTTSRWKVSRSSASCSQSTGWLFATDDIGGKRTASILTIIGTCIAWHINPRAYLHVVCKLLVEGWPNSRLRDLLPDRIGLLHPELCLPSRDEQAISMLV